MTETEDREDENGCSRKEGRKEGRKGGARTSRGTGGMQRAMDPELEDLSWVFDGLIPYQVCMSTTTQGGSIHSIHEASFPVFVASTE